MIINQNTPQIKALRNRSANSVARFKATHIWFSNYAIAEFKLDAGQFATFEYKEETKELFMTVGNNNKNGFKITKARSDAENYLKIESKPLMIFLQRNYKIAVPAKYYMQKVDGADNKIEILIHKPIDKIGE